MERSTLISFVRDALEILFVGLNPARGSSRNGHYFSVNSAFWNQLYESGLITKRVDKTAADDIVFGSNTINFNGWNYGITDLITTVAESDSSRVESCQEDCSRLLGQVRALSPRVVVLLHSKVRRSLARHLGKLEPSDGRIGRWIDCSTDWFCVPFPHGNTISSAYKVAIYREVLEHLTALG